MADIKLKQQKSSEFQGIQDFIEDEPLTIDLKISGLAKRHHIPIERVGVHSYEAEGLCQEQDGEGGFDLVAKPVGLIVNVKTQGRKRVISFESQLLIANNNGLPLTLVFKIRQINRHSQEILDRLEAGDLEQNENMNLQPSNAHEAQLMIQDMLVSQSDHPSRPQRESSERGQQEPKRTLTKQVRV